MISGVLDCLPVFYNGPYEQSKSGAGEEEIFITSIPEAARDRRDHQRSPQGPRAPLRRFNLQTSS